MHIIGDVHGKINQYNRIVSQLNSPSVQVGDMAFSYSGIEANSDRHKFFAGNHDNPQSAFYSPHYLGRFGYHSWGSEGASPSFFYVGGAFSIDIVFRQADFMQTGRKTWFGAEELNLYEMMECLELYKRIKPNIVLSHTCPLSIEPLIGNPQIMKNWGWSDYIQKTPELLQMMLDFHRPELWVFGHFHRSWYRVVDGTKFVCLGELEVMKV